VLFSYEESIGFCCGDVVFDKDGVIGAAVFAEMSIQVCHCCCCAIVRLLCAHSTAVIRLII
jgi:phosphomannomutase